MPQESHYVTRRGHKNIADSKSWKHALTSEQTSLEETVTARKGHTLRLMQSDMARQRVLVSRISSHQLTSKPTAIHAMHARPRNVHVQTATDELCHAQQPDDETDDARPEFRLARTQAATTKEKRPTIQYSTGGIQNVDGNTNDVMGLGEWGVKH